MSTPGTATGTNPGSSDQAGLTPLLWFAPNLRFVMAYQEDGAFGVLGDNTTHAPSSSGSLRRERSVGKLAATLPISRPAVSQHLKVLKDAGLVDRARRRHPPHLPAQRGGAAALRDQLDTFWNRALAGYQDVVDERTRRTDETMTRRDSVVRRQIVVDAPIERAFAVFTERFGDFKPQEHNMLGVPDRRDGVRAARSAGTSTTAARTAASAAGLASSPSSRPTASCSAGTSAPTGSSRPTRPHQRGRGPVHRRDAADAPGSSSSTATSTATAPDGRRPRRRRRRRRMAALPRPLRRRRRPTSLNA